MKKDNNKIEKENNKIDWTEILPRGTAKEIHEILLSAEAEKENSDSGTKIPSAKTIHRILKGESEDGYGILDVAIKMSKYQLRSKEKHAREYSLLKLKRSQPLNQNK